MEFLALLCGLLAGGLLVAMLIWSIAFPAKRLWPPKNSTRVSQIVVWVLTIGVFGGALVLGISDWNYFQWPALLRWGVGLPLILAGNWIAWRGALSLGMEATSGAVGTLKTDGLYKYSRNPQYVADIGIFVGWAVLSASLSALPVAAVGILVLLIAPFAEEPWMKAVYGEEFARYSRRTRRYL